MPRTAKKQLPIPGTQRKRIKAVSDAAEQYADIRDERMELTRKEAEAQDELLGIMTKKEIDHYVDEDLGLEVSIVAEKLKAKVKRRKDPGDEE